ncbi:DNA-directed RNA polymerase subunit alpha [Streptomyces griseoloalbus]
MLIAQRPSLTEEVVDEFRSRFVIEPLEPGFGYTLGNSLRRTLLSSIPGAAVTSIRIDGVLHEFTTVPGVKEDVTDLILNIKQLVVSSEHDEPVVMYLRKQGPGLVTAADIAPPAGVEVHNPDLVLATLNGKGKLEMELTVERGRGYVSAVQNKQVGQEIGRIPVDSIYSPVLKVTYKVEATRVEQRTDFDKLIVDVETKQAMRPRDAMASAGKTLVELFGLARELNIDAEGIDMGPSPTDAALAADLALPIEELELTVRSYNCVAQPRAVARLAAGRGRHERGGAGAAGRARLRRLLQEAGGRDDHPDASGAASRARRRRDHHGHRAGRRLLPQHGALADRRAAVRRRRAPHAGLAREGPGGGRTGLGGPCRTPARPDPGGGRLPGRRAPRGPQRRGAQQADAAVGRLLLTHSWRRGQPTAAADAWASPLRRI